jgi:hypothetical protein
MHAIAGEVNAKLEEISTFPCQRVITQPKIITDPLAFADSMPHHARSDRHEPVSPVTTLLPTFPDSNKISPVLQVTARHVPSWRGWAKF